MGLGYLVSKSLPEDGAIKPLKNDEMSLYLASGLGVRVLSMRAWV